MSKDFGILSTEIIITNCLYCETAVATTLNSDNYTNLSEITISAENNVNVIFKCPRVEYNKSLYLFFYLPCSFLVL